MVPEQATNCISRFGQEPNLQLDNSQLWTWDTCTLLRDARQVASQRMAEVNRDQVQQDPLEQTCVLALN